MQTTKIFDKNYAEQSDLKEVFGNIIELLAPMNLEFLHLLMDLEIFDDAKIDVWDHHENPHDFRSLALGKKNSNPR